MIEILIYLSGLASVLVLVIAHNRAHLWAKYPYSESGLDDFWKRK